MNMPKHIFSEQMIGWNTHAFQEGVKLHHSFFFIFSDLRKPGLVPGKSLSLSAKIYSVLEKYP